MSAPPPRINLAGRADRLRGRVCLVTGGATGLGRAIVERLAAAGARVAINYLSSEEAATTAVAQIRQAGGRAIAVRADVGDWRAAAEMVRQVEAQLGPVDVLINNAGVTRYIPFDRLDEVRQSDWEQILAVNLLGAFACIQAVVPSMRARGRGSILNVASNSALTDDGSSIPYVASKAALVSLTRMLARTLAPRIQVNALAPGWMPTPWLDRYLPEDKRRAIESAPFTPVPVDDVADAALAVLTIESMTGQVVVVDRGESGAAP